VIVVDAYLNPTLCISLITVQKLKPFQFMFYVISQILRIFLGDALLYLVYLKQFDDGIRQMTGLESIPNWNVLVDQIVGTDILMIFVMGVTHVRE
jgi:glycerol uptake facilitator-like aquaporin